MGGRNRGQGRTTIGRRVARWGGRVGVLSAGACLAILGPFANASMAASDYTEHMAVDASQPGGSTTEAWLAAGVTYDVSVEGTYSFGAGETADANCSTADGLTWSSSRYGATALHLTIDGVAVDWIPRTDVVGCDTFDHRYSASFTPSGDGPATFAVEPGPGAQADYAGTLEVDIAGPTIATPPAAAQPVPAPAPPSNTDAKPSDPAPPPADGDAPTTPAGDAPASSDPYTVPSSSTTWGVVAAPVVSHPAPESSPPAAPAAPVAPANHDTGTNALENFMLSDQPKVANRPESHVVLETARPNGRGFQAPSPMLLVPLLAGLVILLRPRQTLAFTIGVARKVPTPGRPSSAAAPWRVEVESTPPPLPLVPSELERPVLSGRAAPPTPRKVRIRRRSW